MNYVLLSVTNNRPIGMPVRVGRTKKELVEYLKTQGYYFSKKVGRYINDRTCKIKGGSGIDYNIFDVESL